MSAPNPYDGHFAPRTVATDFGDRTLCNLATRGAGGACVYYRELSETGENAGVTCRICRAKGNISGARDEQAAEAARILLAWPAKPPRPTLVYVSRTGFSLEIRGVVRTPKARRQRVAT